MLGAMTTLVYDLSPLAGCVYEMLRA